MVAIYSDITELTSQTAACFSFSSKALLIKCLTNASPLTVQLCCGISVQLFKAAEYS